MNTNYWLLVIGDNTRQMVDHYQSGNMGLATVKNHLKCPSDQAIIGFPPAPLTRQRPFGHDLIFQMNECTRSG